MVLTTAGYSSSTVSQLEQLTRNVPMRVGCLYLNLTQALLPSAHSQSYPLGRSKHLAPFKQGVLEHSSMSIWHMSPLKPTTQNKEQRSQSFSKRAVSFLNIEVWNSVEWRENQNTQAACEANLLGTRRRSGWPGRDIYPGSDKASWDTRSRLSHSESPRILQA